MIGDSQVDYRFFIGFKLIATDEEVNLKNLKKSFFSGLQEFVYGVNHHLMGDFISLSNEEVRRYTKLEKLMESKMARRFKVRRVTPSDLTYLIEHIYGEKGTPFEEYEFQLPKKKLKSETLVKRYDLLRPSRCLIEEKPRYLRMEHENHESYVAYSNNQYDCRRNGISFLRTFLLPATTIHFSNRHFNECRNRDE
jgi:hypothetical protein